MKKVLTVLLSLLFFTVVSFANNVKISQRGAEFIKEQEYCMLTAYWDSNGYSIGYGHHSSDVYKGMKITQQEADKIFMEDIKIVEASVKRLLDNLPYKFTFSQDFIDGFISFVYNVGEGGARSSAFYKALKKCRVYNGAISIADYEYAVSKIKTSKVRCKGHKLRRHKEYKMMKGQLWSNQ